MKYTLLSLMFLMFFACKKESADLFKNETQSLDVEHIIPFGDAVLIQDGGHEFKIKFDQLVDEFRCPTDVDCFWEGRVIIQLLVDDEHPILMADAAWQLENGTNLEPLATFEDYTIELLEVNYGEEENYGKAEFYSIKIIVKKS